MPLVCFALPALAPAPLATSTVRGRTTASSGAAIPGAVVTVANRATGKSRVRNEIPVQVDLIWRPDKQP